MSSVNFLADRTRLNMNFTVTGLNAQKFWITYSMSYDDGLFSNYNSGTDLPPIKK
jgi:hypothetical protein